MRLSFILFVVFSFMVFGSAKAADNSYYSPSERIGFAFYRLGSDVEPPYDEWIRTRKDYLDAKNNVRMMMMDRETKRLRDGFYVYDPKADLIPVRTRVDVVFYANPKYQEDGLGLNSAVYRTMTVKFPHYEAMGLFFPFQIGNMWVAFVPHGFETEMTYPLSRVDYEDIASRIGVSKDMDLTNVQAELTLRPRKVDTNAPMEITGESMWLMTGNIASIAVLDISGKKVWEHMSDWYIKSDDYELKRLYAK